MVSVAVNSCDGLEQSVDGSMDGIWESYNDGKRTSYKPVDAVANTFDRKRSGVFYSDTERKIIGSKSVGELTD